MKRIKYFVFLLFCFLVCNVTVWANDNMYVWIPDNMFYMEHMEECVAHGREYYANGPNHKVMIYESPSSSQVHAVMDHQDTVIVDFIYKNDEGIEWGFCEFEGEMGWVPMPYMTLVYDYLCFAEEYADQIKAEHGKTIESNTQEAMDFAFAPHNRIRFWSYPGSESRYTISVKNAQSTPNYTATFVDEDGRKWGFVSQFAGEYLNRWICINSVGELLADYETLYPEGGIQRDKRIIESYEGKEIFPEDYEQVQQQEKTKMMVVIGSVVCSILVFGFLSWKLWKFVKKI